MGSRQKTATHIFSKPQSKKNMKNYKTLFWVAAAAVVVLGFLYVRKKIGHQCDCEKGKPDDTANTAKNQ